MAHFTKEPARPPYHLPVLDFTVTCWRQRAVLDLELNDPGEGTRGGPETSSIWS